MPSRKTQKGKAEAKKYMAFLSYNHEDNETDKGWIREAGLQLGLEVGALDGVEFPIFIDVYDKIAGKWKHNHDEYLDSVPFLIPFVTPRFLKSKACRREVDRFNRRRPKGIILPVFYIECPDDAPGPPGRVLGLLRPWEGAKWERRRDTGLPVSSPESLCEIRAFAKVVFRTLRLTSVVRRGEAE
jgi:hypothetical protein